MMTKLEAVNILAGIFRKSNTVYVATKHRAPSGMSRRVGVYVATQRDSIRDITGLVALACNFRANKDTGEIVIRGCGFSVAQHVAESIASAIGAEHLQHCSL